MVSGELKVQEAKSSSQIENFSYIIALDLDFFYGQVEQLLDPSLKDIPFVVAQKQCVATCSYAARKLGVNKLASLREAKKILPDIKVVNGEDLTKYRDASREIRALVKQYITSKRVEKLGLDEIFVDITDQIENHVKDLQIVSGQVEFDLRPCEGRRSSFTYAFGTIEGIVEPPLQDGAQFYVDKKLAKVSAASHFAAFLRREIFEQLGYTSSAGIAHNKLFAKLLSDVHKPNKQTVLNNWSKMDIVNSWLDQVKVGKLNGFGSKVCKTLLSNIFGSHAVDNFRAQYDKIHGFHQQEEVKDQEFNLTVGFVRSNASCQHFMDWFGNKKGIVLWDLLNGCDPSPVLESADVPVQIGVEDSFPTTNDINFVLRKIATLSESLVKRLQHELCEDGQWKSFPSMIRLSFREYGGLAMSKSAIMPVEIFDSKLQIKEKASILSSSLKSSTREIVSKMGIKWACNIIGITANNMKREITAQSIYSSLETMRNRLPYDPEVFDKLPPDIQEEILGHYDANRGSKQVVNVPDDASYEESATVEHVEGNLICTECGISMFEWMIPLHRQFHIDSDS